ncbi:MAG: carbamate kinase, partial [Gemmatimonadales bacterium]
APTIASQFRHTRESLAPIVKLAADGWNIAIVHGNGPQVGDEIERNEAARDLLPPLPLGVLVASTGGWIGYMIQQSVANALEQRGIKRDVITLVTQTEVSRHDPYLDRPTKPVGHALAADRREALAARGIAVGQDGRGRWRRMAPSPQPIAIIEAAAVGQLVGEGKIVIAAGGGGPPVYFDDETCGWEGVEAVVDKDLSAAVLAMGIGADTLLILTDVNGVYRNWGSEQAALIPRLTVAEAAQLVDSDELGAGSMAPKVAAGIAFLNSGGRCAIIARLAEGVAALEGTAGTTISGDVK